VDDLALLVFLGLAFVSAKTKCAKCAVGFQGDAQRQAVKKPLFSPDNQLSQSNIFVLSQAEFCCVWVSVKNI